MDNLEKVPNRHFREDEGHIREVNGHIREGYGHSSVFLPPP